MKDFGRWMADQGKPQAAQKAIELTLFEKLDKLEALGFDTYLNGDVYCPCCVCERTIHVTDYLTVDEILADPDIRPDNQYCGGSPSCCP